MLKIGVVVHGPEVIDSGSASKVLERLKTLGEVTAVLGGTMGRHAIIDAGAFDDLIGISSHRRPSETIGELQTFVDLVVVLCQAKNRESGLAFGTAVAAKARSSRLIVQVDCGGEFVASLAAEAILHAAAIADLLGLELLIAPIAQEGITREGGTTKRKLRGVQPGEIISINGTIVAKAIDSSVQVYSKGARIIAFKGAQPNLHGIEKLPVIDLEKAIIRSGDIRRTESKPKAGDCKGDLLQGTFPDHL